MLEKLVKQLSKSTPARAPTVAAAVAPVSFRFSASGLAAQRRRLGLSAAQLATLLGVSGQSVYKWEDGKTRPRASQLPAIAALRKMGKKDATERLGALQ